MLTPAAIAILLVLARSYPSFTKMRAVARNIASTVACDRACCACFLGIVRARGATGTSVSMRVANMSYRSHNRNGDYADIIARYADASLARFPNGAELDLSEEMMRLTFEVVGKTLFNADLGGDAKDVGEALTAAMRHMISSINSLLPVPPSI